MCWWCTAGEEGRKEGRKERGRKAMAGSGKVEALQPADVECDVKSAVEALEPDAWVNCPAAERLALLRRAYANCKRVDWEAMGRGAAKVEMFDPESTAGTNYALMRGVLDFVICRGVFGDRLKTYKPKVESKFGQQVLAQKGSMISPSFQVWLKRDLEQAYDKSKHGKRMDGGGVALVLGAGNQTFLSLSDCLSMLLDENCCVVLKVHPLRAYAKEWFQVIFSDFIQRGFVRVVTCSLEDTNTLIQHERVTRCHMTGGRATHDAIVWGTDGAKRDGKPKLQKPMTSELGCVTPVIVASGGKTWTARELRSQAQALAGPAIGNAGCNCLSPKLVVMDEDWPQREAFIEAVKQVIDEQFIAPAYYPGASDRYDRFLTSYENDKSAHVSFHGKSYDSDVLTDDAKQKKILVVQLGETSNPYAFENEPFAPVLSFVSLKGGQNDASVFFERATAFVNDRVFGTLSCMMVVHDSIKKPVVEKAIASLKYGSIVVNGWSVFGFNNYWGGHPEVETLEQVQSGLGWVNQTLDVDPRLVEKSAVILPFNNFFQRATAPDDLTKPKWRVTFTRALLNAAVKPSVRTVMTLIYRYFF